MTQKTTVQQLRFTRNGYSFTLAFLAAVLIFVTAADAAGTKAYVGNFKDNTISVIDLDSKGVAATISIPPGPHGMVITPDNRWLYVASDGASTVSVIDTERINWSRTSKSARILTELPSPATANLSWLACMTQIRSQSSTLLPAR